VIVEGDVVHRGASPYAFSEHELEEGSALLCSTFARSSLVIAPFGDQLVPDGFELIPPEQRTARLTGLGPVSADLVEVSLRLDLPLRYRAGQYVEIEIPETGERRSYSMTAPPEPSGDVALLVDARHRAVLGALADLGPDDRLTLLGPFGRLFHRPADRPVLMAGVGAGIAPLLAILRELVGHARPPKVRFYYGFFPGGMPYGDELLGLARRIPGFTLWPLELDPADPAGRRLAGLVRRIGGDVADASDYDAYVAGAPGLCDAVASLLMAKGLPQRRMFAERFYAVSSVSRTAP
jgi:NAD(P)H-flavin reductase